MSSVPDVSIVVIGWKDAPDLVGCLEQVAASPTTATREVIVTLNEPSDTLLDTLRARLELFDQLEISDFNRGYSVANNAGVERASGRFLYFLNDDARVTSGWLDPLCDRLTTDASVGIAASVLVDRQGTVVEAGCMLYSDGALAERSVAVLGDDRSESPVVYASSAGALVRRNEFEMVGGFDAGYFPAYYEDTDLALKFLGRGLGTWSIPSSVVMHHHESSGDRRYASFLVTRNRKRLLQRWPDLMAALPERPAHLTEDGLRSDARAAGEAVSAMCAAPPQSEPKVKDAYFADEELQKLEVEIFHEYVSSLVSYVGELEDRVHELEERETHTQLVIAQQLEALDRLAPRNEELRSEVFDLTQRLAEAVNELEQYRARFIVRLAEGASSLTKRRSNS